jgi:MFS family permease
LQTVLEVSLVTSALIVGAALILATPFFLVFGRLSDRIGRKRIILAGCLLGAVTYVPLYAAMNAVSDPLNAPVMVLLIFIQVIYVTMVYGPIAAFLVELFPAKVRYTSLSLPYHIGNGVFGGLVPLVSSAIVAATGNIYAGLSYPIAIALMTFFVGIFLLRETNTVRIYEEVGIAPEEARSIVPT